MVVFFGPARLQRRLLNEYIARNRHAQLSARDLARLS
jgi:hypothetical protein